MATARPRSIVITGCSSGFGRVTALHLLRRGWTVIASVRREEDRDSLVAEAAAAGAQPSSLTVVIADITRAADVASLAEVVRGGGGSGESLGALLNNAGTAYPAPLELLSLDELRAQLEINVIAQLAVTQAMLPFLKRGRGTIVNVSSPSGRMAPPLLGAYAMSKFALEAMSDVLRIELGGLGVRVVVIEPGPSPTRIFKTSADRALGKITGDTGPYARMIDIARKYVAEVDAVGFPPQLFADTIERILDDPDPDPRYAIPAAVRRRLFLRRFLSDRAIDRIIRKRLGP